MKVLHVITNFSALGGAESMLSRLIQAQLEHEHHVIALMRVNDTYQAALDRCASVKALHWNGINTLSCLLQLRRQIKALQPAVIQCWMYHANVLVSLACLGVSSHPPIVWGIHHSLAALKDESRSTKLALLLSRRLSARPEAIVYCAHAAAQQHQQFGFHSARGSVIPNGIALQDFHTQAERHTPMVIGFAGRYHAAKGFEYLFAMIAKLQALPVVFHLAGKGVEAEQPEIAELMQRYQIAPHKVICFGPVHDMPRFYQGLDLLVMTSITEGLPTVLIEAMASGVPCVTTDVGDAGFIVQETGYVVPARDVDALADAVTHYFKLSDTDQQILKTQARARVAAQFSLDHVANQYAALWASCQ